MPPAPSRRRRRRSLRSNLLRIAWQVPVASLLFGFFFWLINGGAGLSLPGFMLVAFIFTFTISTGIVLAEAFLYPRLVHPGPSGTASLPQNVAFYGTASALGTFLAGFIVQTTMHVPIYHSAASIVLFLFFTVIFGGLFIGISLAAYYHRESIRQAREQEELKLAREMQQAFLPDRFPESPGFDVYAVNRSSKQVSGDFYDVLPAGDGLFLAIADVSGKGFPAALLASMLQASLRTQAGEKESTAAITRTANALTAGTIATGKFVTLFLAQLDTRTLKLRYTNAGHNPPLLFRSAGGHETLEEGGTIVGAFRDLEYGEGMVSLRAGDRLVLYTDGVTEALNAREEMFGEERLISLIAGLPPDSSARTIVDATLASLDAFLGETEPGDDITLLVLRIPNSA